jgi:hypothetical protein
MFLGVLLPSSDPPRHHRLEDPQRSKTTPRSIRSSSLDSFSCSSSFSRRSGRIIKPTWPWESCHLFQMTLDFISGLLDLSRRSRMKKTVRTSLPPFNSRSMDQLLEKHKSESTLPSLLFPFIFHPTCSRFPFFFLISSPFLFLSSFPLFISLLFPLPSTYESSPASRVEEFPAGLFTSYCSIGSLKQAIILFSYRLGIVSPLTDPNGPN